MDFNWIRASILVPFQHHVHYFLHAFFKYWFSIQKHPARSPFWHSGAAARPEASKTSPVALKTSSVELKTGPVQRATAHFWNGFWLKVERIWFSFGMYSVCIWNRYFMILQRIDAFECIPVECFRAYSHIDITSPSIKYYDGVGGMRR